MLLALVSVAGIGDCACLYDYVILLFQLTAFPIVYEYKKRFTPGSNSVTECKRGACTDFCK
jgi:hypothetical protein